MKEVQQILLLGFPFTSLSYVVTPPRLIKQKYHFYYSFTPIFISQGRFNPTDFVGRATIMQFRNETWILITLPSALVRTIQLHILKIDHQWHQLSNRSQQLTRYHHQLLLFTHLFFFPLFIRKYTLRKELVLIFC